MSHTQYLAFADELLQRANFPRRIEFAASVSPGHFSHINIASGVNANAMRGNESSGSLALRLVTQTRQQLALGIVYADARTETARLVVGSNGRTEFADIGQCCRWVNIETAGPRH